MSISETEKKNIIKASPAWIIDSHWRRDCKEWGVIKTDLIHFEKQCNQQNHEQFFRVVRRFDSISTVQNDSILEFNFDPSFQDFNFHSCTVFRNGNFIDKSIDLKIKIFQKEARSNEYIYDGTKTAAIFLDDIREKDVIEYSYSYLEHKPFYKDHFVEGFFFTLNEEAARLFYRLIGYNEIFFKNHQSIIKPVKKDLNDGLSEWIWDVERAKAGIFESFQPFWYDPYSWVQITSFQSWNDVSKWAESLFPITEELSQEILNQVEIWKRETETIEELVCQIIKFVQKGIRYLSIGNELGNHVATCPIETFKRRFGDCKDKTLLLFHLLKLIDIESYPALVHTSRRGSLLQWAPSPAAFNHVILQLKLNGNTYWIDSTHTFQGGNLLNSCPLLFQKALVIRNGSNHLENIQQTGEDKTSVISSINLFNDGSGEIDVENHFYGSDADTFRGNYKQTSLEKFTNNYKDFYNRIYKNVSAKKLLVIEDDADRNYILMNESYKIGEFGEKQGDTFVYKYHFFPYLLSPYLVRDIDLTRSSPMGLPYPLDLQEEIRINLPKSVTSEVSSESILSDFVEFKSSWNQPDDRTLVLKYSLKYLTDSVLVEDLSDLRKFMDRIYDTASVQLTLNLAKKIQASDRTKEEGFLLLGSFWSEHLKSFLTH